MNDRPRPDEPGYSRDEGMEESRLKDRPAEADLDGDPNEGRPIRYAPVPDDPDGVR